MNSQAAIDVLPKKFPFSNRKLPPKSKYDFSYHVDILGKYSKRLPKREESALDLRHTQSGMHWNDTTKFLQDY